LVSVIVVLIAYALLGEQWRFSRAYALFFSVNQLFVPIIIRFLLSYAIPGNYFFEDLRLKKYFLITGIGNREKIKNLILNRCNDVKQIFPISTKEEKVGNEQFVTGFSQLSEAVDIFRPENIIYSSFDLTYSQIVSLIAQNAEKIPYQFIAFNELTAISSDKIITSDEIHFKQITAKINKKYLFRAKKILDYVFSLCYLIFYPFVQQRVRTSLKDVADIFFNKKTWIGKCPAKDSDKYYYISCPKGVFCAAEFSKDELEYYYNYNLWKDVEIYLQILTKSKR
jgi:hypothetical protein